MVAIRNVIAVALFAAFVSAQGGMPHLTSDQWIAEAPVEAAGGTLALSWKDCGDSKTHAKVTAVTPSSITLGAKTTISGSGTVDEDVTGGTFTMTMKGIGGMKLLDCGGDASQQKSCDVKVGFIKIGTLSFGGVTFPVKAGTISGIPKVDVSLASSLPAAAATTTTNLLVTSASGDKIICVDIFTKPATTGLVEEPALVAPLVNESRTATTTSVQSGDCNNSTTINEGTNDKPCNQAFPFSHQSAINIPLIYWTHLRSAMALIIGNHNIFIYRLHSSISDAHDLSVISAFVSVEIAAGRQSLTVTSSARQLTLGHA